MMELLRFIGLGLMMILPLANPLTTLALFLALSGGMSQREQRRQIAQTCIYVFVIMMAAFYGGQLILETFGISIPGLRMAGGLIVGLIGINMLFEPQKSGSGIEAGDKEKQLRTTPEDQVNIAFVPLAMPSTAGPGTIAMLISSAAHIKSGVEVTPWVMAIAPTITFLCVTLILWLCLRSAGLIMKKLGTGGIAAISRLMGFLLVCMGMQFIINGVLEIIQGLQVVQ